MKILSIVGARPNFAKVSPLIREMKKYPEIEPILVHTGQHYDAKMSGDFFADLELPTPDTSLGVGSGSHAQQTARVMERLEPELLKYRPDVVLVVGDVNSTAAAALTAAKLDIQVAHVEAGLRSFDRSMPEEINRIVTDSVSTYFFASEPSAVDNLKMEGHYLDQIHFVGNVMIDSLLYFLPQARRSGIRNELGLTKSSPFALLTLHRASNTDSFDKFLSILCAACNLSERIPVIFPAHPRLHPMLENFSTRPFPNFKIVKPLGYLDFLCLMERATLVLTDSGGIQEETSVLNVPCLTLRENTERPLTVQRGTNTLVGTAPSTILLAAHAALRRERAHSDLPLYYRDGKASERIVKILLTYKR